ncbi:MAG: right-handed parallel beta-helix repeat-containing protein [Bacteroidetes bacterium]|jgi:parallel beta-helix repeat protein|nr:right-handed parallel beta-helix repeat-containing protein [Bacteroidota bacterium]
MKKSNFTLIILLLIVQLAFGQTTIPDSTTISGNWTLANAPYLIEGRAIVPSGESLIIEPGVEIRLKSSASPSPSWFDYSAGNVGVIRVHGNLIANGTADNPILFTKDNAGYWGAILLDENIDGGSSFKHCIIEYAKETRNVPDISLMSFDGGLSIYKTNATIESNEFRNNSISGLYIREVSNLISFSENKFYDNGTNGLVIEESTANCINNTFYNNSTAATGAVSAIRSSDATVYLTGNLIYNNDDFGIYVKNGGNHHIINNTIYGNEQGIRVESGANTFIHSTIIQNNTLNFATGSIGGATIEMQYSLTDDVSLPDNISDIAGNIIGSDAGFINPGANNYSLQNTSPCIDAGNPDTTGLNIPITDILGNIRIENNIIDIGALEFQNTIVNYTLSTSSNPTSGGTTTGDGTYESGSNVTVTATPNTNFVFSNWTENGNVVSTAASFNFTINSDRNLVANFLEVFTLSTSSNPSSGGTTTGDGTYESGNNVTVTATPNTNFVFSNWTENGNVVSTNQTYSFIITENLNLIANFESTVGIAQSEISNMPVVYPNPTHGIINVNIDGFLNAKLFTIHGQLIASFDAKTINLSAQKPGIYILRTVTKEGKTIMIRIAKE